MSSEDSNEERLARQDFRRYGGWTSANIAVIKPKVNLSCERWMLLSAIWLLRRGPLLFSIQPCGTKCSLADLGFVETDFLMINFGGSLRQWGRFLFVLAARSMLPVLPRTARSTRSLLRVSCLGALPPGGRHQGKPDGKRAN